LVSDFLLCRLWDPKSLTSSLFVLVQYMLVSPAGAIFVNLFLDVRNEKASNLLSSTTAKSGHLQLDRAIVTREVGFYALAIALLYYALRDHRPLDSDPDGPDHIFISFHEALLVFSGYIAYVIVCAKMDAVVGFFTQQHRTIRDTLRGEHATYGAIGKSSKKVQ
jgi:hypothetical protein